MSYRGPGTWGLCAVCLIAAACGGNNGKNPDAGANPDGGVNQTPAHGTVTGTGISANVANAECVLMSPGADGVAALAISSSQLGGMTFTQPADPDGGLLMVNLQLRQLDAGVYTGSNGLDCGQINFNFASSLNGGDNGWTAGLDCDGGTPSGSWTLTLTSVGPPVPNGMTGGFLYAVDGTLTATLPTIFVSPPAVQVSLSF